MLNSTLVPGTAAATKSADANAVALLIRQPAPIERVPVVQSSDLKKLLRGEFPFMMKYSVMEVRNCDNAKLVIRFGTFRKPDEEMLSGTASEARLVDAKLSVRQVESGTFYNLPDYIAVSNMPANTGVGFGMLDQILTQRGVLY
ncbi:MAG: hypothetical protein KGH94_04420 [Candidatus Micrarchaeota archaeon]|nr:hypothetical protein [Candidatus Micrarchaeota archaeon]